MKTTLRDDAVQRSRKSRERAANKTKEYVGIHPCPAHERLEASNILETGKETGDWEYSIVQYSTVQYDVKKRDGGKGREEGKGRTRLGFSLGFSNKKKLTKPEKIVMEQ